VVRPGSQCGSCGQPVRWYDNIPILSYLVLRGSCRDCGASFSARYLFVEAAMGMLFVAVYHHAVGLVFIDEPLSLRTTRFLILAAFAFVLVVIAFIDLDHKLILDRITYPAIPVFYGLGLLLPERTWHDGLIGAAVGYLVVRVVADGYYFLTKREGMGYGDGKLLAIVGALHGWQGVVVALFIGSVLGSVIGTAALVIARSRGGEPFDSPLRHARSADGSGRTEPARAAQDERDNDDLPDRVYRRNAKDPIKLRAHTTELFLLARLRDEAHRFANAFHRQRRKRSALRSALDDIPGIGAKRRKQLLRHFGSLKAIKAASVEDLARAPSMNRKAAEAVRRFFDSE